MGKEGRFRDRARSPAEPRCRPPRAYARTRCALAGARPRCLEQAASEIRFPITCESERSEPRGCGRENASRSPVRVRASSTEG
jgi:hypothetical protein